MSDTFEVHYRFTPQTGTEIVWSSHSMIHFGALRDRLKTSIQLLVASSDGIPSAFLYRKSQRMQKNNHGFFWVEEWQYLDRMDRLVSCRWPRQTGTERRFGRGDSDE